MDNRLGQGNTWPKVDIFGNAYERGVGATAGVGQDYFVVLPPGFVDDGTLAALRAEHAPKPAPKGKKDDKDASG